MPQLSLQQARARVGQEIGTSEWFLLDQSRIDAFATVTEDHQFIHCDPERAQATPFGGTIAHGFLILSMLSRMAEHTAVGLEGAVMGINYGFDRIRFLSPVRAEKRVRGRFLLAEIREREGGRWMLRYTVTVEIEGNDKPALSADWLTLQQLGSAA